MFGGQATLKGRATCLRQNDTGGVSGVILSDCGQESDKSDTHNVKGEGDIKKKSWSAVTESW